MAKEKSILDQKLKVVNIGLDSFYKDLMDQGTDVIHVDWRPPADGDPKLMDILDKLDLL